jgi:putative ABC transport system permease protein
LDREFGEEIESHLAMHIEDNLRAGTNPEEARRNALIKLGGIDKVFEEHRDRRGLPWLAEVERNFRYAFRILRKQWALSLTVICLLAVASAANTTIFSVYNCLYLRSFPYPHGERLVAIDSAALYARGEQNQSFDGFGFYNPDNRNYSRQGSAGTMNILLVTSGFASVFQLQPVLGRGFLEEEDRPGEPKVVMLGYGFWQREFGGSPSALGETLKLDGEVHTVVGVLPSDADFPERADVWVLFQRDRNDVTWYPRGIGRLKEGVTLEQAREDVGRIHRAMIERRPVNEKIVPPRLQSLRESVFGNTRRIMSVMLFAVGILLLVVCFNIAGMMLARSESRSQEMAIRTALGASRAGIVRQLMTESVLLAIPGVLLGMLIGQALLKIYALKLEAPNWMRFTPDIRFWAFCVALTGAAAIFFGLAPALQAARVNVQCSLHEANPRASAGGAKRRGLKLLVFGEIALAVVLLVGAGLLLRAWQKMLAVDPGFRAENVFTFNIKLPAFSYGYKGENDPGRFFERFIEQLRQIPGVLSVSGANNLPLGGAYNQVILDVEGVPPCPASEPDPITVRWVFPDYFKTMAIPLISGRDFDEKDGRTEGSCVTIVEQSFARRYWPGVNPIGRRVRMQADYYGRGMWVDFPGDKPWTTVVGVARDVTHYGLDKAIQPGIYIPYNMRKTTQMYIVVRSTIGPSGIVGPIRSQLHAIDPDVAVWYPMTMTEVMDKSTVARRVIAIAMTIFAVAALLIAAAGIYGIVSYTVSRRTHEIGIRIALGATRDQVLSMVVGESMRLVLAGAVFGVAGAYVASRALRHMLFGITSFDAPTYVAVTVLLIGVVAAASLLPARRAATIDPMRALRSE